jgi:formamidopyrimidine-DNA glycosylase
MPELPDVTVYVEALERRIAGARLERVRVGSPFVLRTFDPPIQAAEGRPVLGVRRVGKRIVIALEDELFLVIHLMVAGRLRWRKRGSALPRGRGLAAFDFPDGTLLFTEEGKKHRAGLWLVQGEDQLAAHDPGGLEPLDLSLDAFAAALTAGRHTLKRRLTDPHVFSGIGNAYSDEILHAAKLSPLQLTTNLEPEEIERLHGALQATLLTWTGRLRRETRRISGEGHRLPRRNGGARPIPQTLPRLRRAGAADQICGERGELLRGVPDRGKGPGGSRDVPTAEGGLAEVDR